MLIFCIVHGEIKKDDGCITGSALYVIFAGHILTTQTLNMDKRAMLRLVKNLPEGA